MPAEIVLAVGTEYVEREEAPRLIADALHPRGQNSDALAVFKAACEEEHAAAISRAISSGEMRMRSPLSFLPAGPLHANALIPVDDLTRYAAKLGITVKFQNELTPIWLFARKAAEGDHPLVYGESGRRRDIRNAARESTEKDYLERLLHYVGQGTLRAVNSLNNAPYDPTLPHLDLSDPVWALDAHECAHALELIGQQVQTKVGSGRTVARQSVAANDAEVRETQERQARGFYTLQEAIRVVAEANPDVSEQRLLSQALEAAKHGLFVVRDPATQAPVRDRGAIRDFWHWVTPADMDVLFVAWGVPYRFPKSDAAGGTEKVPRVPAAEAQDKSILAKLRELGFDPMALPKCKPGAASPAKKAIKDSAMYTPSVVDHAWKRLRKDGKLREA